MIDKDTLANMLHDIRSPLAAIMLSLELLEQERLGPINKKQKEMLAAIRQSAQKLNGAISQLPWHEADSTL